MSALVTAAEAQTLLDALMAANELQCAAGRPCRACDARIDAVRALTDDAPALVATVTAQADEIKRLLALLADHEEKPDADEVDYLDALLARQHTILTGVANALRGDPGPLASHSHHDLAERAAAMVALLAVTQSSLEAASSGRRVTACDEIERLQRERDALRDAAREYLDARAAYDAADTYEATNADDERRAWERRAAAQGALRALVGGTR